MKKGHRVRRCHSDTFRDLQIAHVDTGTQLAIVYSLCGMCTLWDEDKVREFASEAIDESFEDYRHQIRTGRRRAIPEGWKATD